MVFFSKFMRDDVYTARNSDGSLDSREDCHAWGAVWIRVSESGVWADSYPLTGRRCRSLNLSIHYNNHPCSSTHTISLLPIAHLCFDDGCHLRKFACSDKRKDITKTSKWMSTIKWTSCTSMGMLTSSANKIVTPILFKN